MIVKLAVAFKLSADARASSSSYNRLALVVGGNQLCRVMPRWAFALVSVRSALRAVCKTEQPKLEPNSHIHRRRPRLFGEPRHPLSAAGCHWTAKGHSQQRGLHNVDPLVVLSIQAARIYASSRPLSDIRPSGSPSIRFGYNAWLAEIRIHTSDACRDII